MPTNKREDKEKAFGELLDVLDTLRVKCPWDKKQTNESLRPNTIEEVMELADAISLIANLLQRLHKSRDLGEKVSGHGQ